MMDDIAQQLASCLELWNWRLSAHAEAVFLYQVWGSGAQDADMQASWLRGAAL